MDICRRGGRARRPVALHADFGLNVRDGTPALCRVVGDEANLGFDLEGQLGQDVRELISKIRVVQEIPNFFGNGPIKTVLGLVELVQHVPGQAQLAHEMAHILGALTQALIAGLEYAFDELRQDPFEAAYAFAFVSLRTIGPFTAHHGEVPCPSAAVKPGTQITAREP